MEWANLAYASISSHGAFIAVILYFKILLLLFYYVAESIIIIQTKINPFKSMNLGEPPCGQLNPKNNQTYNVLEKLYSELIDATGTTDVFHLGGDEVNLDCWSQYFNDTDLRSLWCDFMIQAYQRLKKANKNMAPKFVLVWSSALTSSQCLSRLNFAVQIWGGSTWQENYDLITNGFNVIISHVDAWYFDCGFGSWRATGEGACSPYTTWQRVYKHRPWERMHLDGTKMKQVSIENKNKKLNKT